MMTHQYVQHDWSPLVYAEGLAVMALLVVLGMCVFLLGATRAKRTHPAGPGMQEGPRPEVGAQRPARL
ncbi:hypothetical protein [Nocardioides okcheonensis]|uniref:hypothetical protein n=1 Tax=Nocardioides okcheonensis TaxID=2894081 RepID=UPI001E59AF42|nr:hypothetical protein [Nocardioides okcheonensis]UFN43239.1 hypothetical protein LN652_14425 [Nocardioides okcheonensis]